MRLALLGTVAAVCLSTLALIVALALDLAILIASSPDFTAPPSNWPRQLPLNPPVRRAQRAKAKRLDPAPAAARASGSAILFTFRYCVDYFGDFTYLRALPFRATVQEAVDLCAAEQLVDDSSGGQFGVEGDEMNAGDGRPGTYWCYTTISAEPRRYTLVAPRITSRSLSTTPKMASIVQAAASTAHSAFASLASASPVKAGDKVPDVEIRINDMEDKVNFSKLTGKNVLVLVPGAFSPTCSSQVPSYIDSYAEYTKKGVKDVYVVTVNDMFVVKAWKQQMLAEAKKESETSVKFAADDAGTLAHALGLVLDAQAIFGGPRLKRGAIVIEDGLVKSVVVEENPGAVSVSHADEVLKHL
ncbi:Redoxin-domain-containing protein [Dioszegia hungarica]|uniref:Redoxin-domain-containing protein n=1 Tax=Dioszegia hungarica TaxID=4972 RepID=A0AA38H2R0_9TREE|nr:Redoxin-domain-containing protein [Dioszegia hungarica]KAI9632827.1 Redoxin-domain-containing protein [Dioszegia hungarica]